MSGCFVCGRAPPSAGNCRPAPIVIARKLKVRKSLRRRTPDRLLAIGQSIYSLYHVWLRLVRRAMEKRLSLTDDAQYLISHAVTDPDLN